jgi:anti-anti-sigma regulatory factor
MDMGTANVALFLKVDAVHVADSLREAAGKFDGNPTVLDFSSVRRIDPQALRVLEELADNSDEQASQIRLRGVNVDVYKVLKLVNLAPRFCFVS